MGLNPEAQEEDMVVDMEVAISQKMAYVRVKIYLNHIALLVDDTYYMYSNLKCGARDMY